MSTGPRPSALKLALGWGSSGSGVYAWWRQRLTAIALIPLTIWFLFFVGGLVHAGYPDVLRSMANPVNAGLLILLAICLYWHGALGVQVIIDDYVHTRWRNLALQIALRFGAFVGVLACIMAVLAIWLGGIRG